MLNLNFGEFVNSIEIDAGITAQEGVSNLVPFSLSTLSDFELTLVAGGTGEVNIG
jgi:hypothetical protein